MKNLLIIILGSVFIYSCDPDIPGEGINLPAMNFGFKVSPDTAFIKLGDTLTLHTSISNILENGVVVKDGKAVMSGNILYKDEIPISVFGFIGDLVDEYLYIKTVWGDVDIHTTGLIREYHAYPTEDSIKFELKIIPRKVGTYGIYLYSNFFEGSQGKTRTQPFFDISNNHFDELWKIPGDELGPGDYGYDNAYLFAVYE